MSQFLSGFVDRPGFLSERFCQAHCKVWSSEKHIMDMQRACKSGPDLMLAARIIERREVEQAVQISLQEREKMQRPSKSKPASSPLCSNLSSRLDRDVWIHFFHALPGRSTCFSSRICFPLQGSEPFIHGSDFEEPKCPGPGIPNLKSYPTLEKVAT